MAKTLLPVQGAWVPSLVRELDSICCSKSRVLAATKIQWNQINIKKNKQKMLEGGNISASHRYRHSRVSAVW